MAVFKQKITVAVTGASGSPYVLRLLECLVAADYSNLFIVLVCCQGGFRY